MAKRAAQFLQDYLVLNVIIFSAAAYFLPAWALAIKPYLNYFFALTMFCVGMLIPEEQIKMLKTKPQRALAGSLMQFFLMPLLAYLCCVAFGIKGDLRTGMILTGAVPGAMASNLMSSLAGADVALSVSITTLSTILAPMLTPLLLLFYGGNRLEMPFLSMVTSISWMVVIPVVAGYLIKLRIREKVKSARIWLSATASFAIIIIVAIVVAANRESLFATSLAIIGALIIMNFSGYIFGYAGGTLLKWNVEAKKTVSLEVGMQNAGLGTVLTLTFFSPESAIPPAIYTVLCLITSAILVNFWERRLINNGNG